VAKKAQVPADSELQAKLGLVVRARRQQLGITQEELAWRADMHRTYIADIERGARNVTLRSVASLAGALEVTVGDLVCHATEMEGHASNGFIGTSESAVRDILLVEDNLSDAALTARAFKSARITNPLRIVRDAETGLDYLFGTGRYAKKKPVHPQLVLLDLNLPRMSGVEFLRRLKGNSLTKEIPLIVLTVSHSDKMIIECSQLGADNFIVKPLGIESFVRVAPKLNMHLTLSWSANGKKRAALA